MKQLAVRMGVVLTLLSSVWTVHAQGVKEALAFSSFQGVSVSQVSGGEILANRTPVNLEDAMAVETLSFIPKPPDQVVKALMKWDPTSHKDMEIIMHKQVGMPAQESDFEGFAINAKYDEEKWLLEQSINSRDGETKLNISYKDVSKLSKAGEKAGSVSAAWRAILLGKTTAYQKGGLAELEPYQGPGISFAPKKEISNFMERLPRVSAEFKDLLGMISEKDSRAAADSPQQGAEAKDDSFQPAYYWEKIKASNQTAAVLGTVKARQQGEEWQVADLQYFVSNNYYTSLILYDIIPAKDGSLVWRGDYILTPEVGEMKGVEKVFSDNILIQEVKKAINYFRKDIGK